MAVVQGIVAAIATVVVGVPFAAALSVWGDGGVEKEPTDTNSAWDDMSAAYRYNLLVVVVALVLVDLAVADPDPDNGCVWAIAALSVSMVAAVPFRRYGKGVCGLPLALHVSGALTLAAGCLSVGALVAEPRPDALRWVLLAVAGAGVATTSVLALVRAQVTLTVVPIAVAVLVTVFGWFAHSAYDSPGYAMRYGHPVRMGLPAKCVVDEGMACWITWNRADHGSSPAFTDGQEVLVHFSPEGRSRYGRYYALGGFYEPGDDNDPTPVSLDTRAVGDKAYVTIGYEADSLTPLGRFRLPGLVWAALPLSLLPLLLHLYLVRDRETQPLRRRHEW